MSKIKDFFWEKGYLTENDKKTIIASLNKAPLKKNEARDIYHNRTMLKIAATENGYKAQKWVNGGNNYTYFSFFREKYKI